MDLQKLSNHLLSLPPEARGPTEGLLGQITHDIRTPLATLVMEIFSIRFLFGKLAPPSSAPSGPELSKALATLNEICGNMERASAELSEYLLQLASFRANDQGPPVESPVESA